MFIFSQGALKTEDFQGCLATFFSIVTPEEMEGLMRSAKSELGEFEDGEVPFRDLFTEVRVSLWDFTGKSQMFLQYFMTSRCTRVI